MVTLSYSRGHQDASSGNRKAQLSPNPTAFPALCLTIATRVPGPLWAVPGILVSPTGTLGYQRGFQGLPALGRPVMSKEPFLSGTTQSGEPTPGSPEFLGKGTFPERDSSWLMVGDGELSVSEINWSPCRRWADTPTLPHLCFQAAGAGQAYLQCPPPSSHSASQGVLWGLELQVPWAPGSPKQTGA